MPGPLNRGGFAPAELARAWRDEHPGMFDDIDDAELIQAIRQEDPDTYALVDPLLEGAEILSGRPAPASARQPMPPPPRDPSSSQIVGTGLRVVPPLVAGGAAAFLTKNPAAVAAASAAASGAGELLGQTYEKWFGEREAYNPYTVATNTALGALNPAARGSTMLARTASQVSYGAGLGAGGGAINTYLETGQLPSIRESGMQALVGATLGGATHAGFEALGAAARRAPGGDWTGALPTEAGPPPSPLDQMAVAQAAAAQYQAEEDRLAQGLMAVYGPDARPATGGDLHDAMQAKDYLEQLAALNRRPLPVPPIHAGAALEPPPAAPLQLPAAAGPDAGRPILAFPPGSQRNVELVGSSAPSPSRVVGGTDVGYVQPPPTFEEAVESSLQAPPGPPRLVRPLELSSSPAGIAEPGPPPLLSAPRTSTEGPIRQGARMGGRRTTPEQPRIPGTDQPAPLDNRPYATGPNAGPRRPGEQHGQPRKMRRQVRTGEKISYEYPPSKLEAEDPGTYPPEVRRELAAMAWELDQFRHERFGSALRGVGDSAQIAELRKSGLGKYGSIPGAPVYHDVLAAAEGSYSHATRATMLKQIRAALLEGKGSGLTDAAAQVARQRLAERKYGLKRGSRIIADRGDEGDALIGWVDRTGAQALPEQDLSPAQREIREMSDAELRGALRLREAGLIPPGMEEFEDAIVDDAVRRGLITPEQQGLIMEGPGGDKGPRLFDFEGGTEPRPVDPDGPPPMSPEKRAAQDERNRQAYEELSKEPPAYTQTKWIQAGREMERRVREGTGPGGIERRAEARGEVPSPPTETVRLYRGGPAYDPNYAAAHPVVGRTPRNAGQWFTTSENKARGYGDGEMQYVDVPRDVLEATRAPGAVDEHLLPEVWAARAQALESQPALPGAEGVREQNIPTPQVADVPFALTPPPAQKPAITPKTGNLFQDLLREEGVLILDIPAGDRAGFRRWLKSHEAEHGTEPWFNRAEQAVEDGDWDKAWKTAASASVRSYARAYTEAKDPAALERAVRGTPLQADLNTEIIAGARRRAGVNEAPPVKDFPPSRRATQAGAARGKATLGPAGILNPGPRQRPLSSVAPAVRAATLDREVVKLIMEGVEEVEGLSTVPGNTDTYLRLFRQVGDQIYKGKNLKLLREAGVKIAPEELAQHWNATISDAGRTLQLMSSFAQAHREVLTEAAEAMSMGGAVRGMLGGGPPVYTGARGRVASAAGQKATQEVIDEIAERTSRYQATALANDLQRRAPVGPIRALHDASYAWMLSKWNTAVRNYISYVGRYSMDSLDHALTIPIARLTGDEATASLSRELLRERGAQPMGRKGTAVVPRLDPNRGAWADDLQGIYDFTADNLNRLDPDDARKAIALLLHQPEQMAHFLGAASGEDLSSGFTNTPVLRHLTNPKVQRFLTMFNRAQEFSARATVFDATTRAQLRVKGLEPDTVLNLPTPQLIEAVGGQRAFDDLLYTSTAQALEATFAGRTSKDSLPAALIRFINDAWPFKLGIPFPRFNLSAAPRWLWDHSPAALLDLARFPLDRAGITAPKGTVAGSRLYRGVRAQEITRTELPALQVKITQAERAQGEALQELLGTQREYQVRARQIARLQARAQQGLPGIQGELDAATQLQTQLGRRREQLKARIAESKGVVTDLKSEQKKLMARVEDATGINAPNYAQFLARVGTGTVGMLGAAWVVRAQDGAKGTRWYEYRVDREGKDPIILDFRPFAPFAQYLFVADVMNDFWQNTDWKAVHDETLTPEEGAVASPLDWSRAIWNNYEGKYTEAELGTQFAQAFLSISRAAGTTLTLTDMLTNMDVPSLEEASRAVVGTIGQFLSRFTVPGQQIGDIAAHFDPEEAKVRTPPKATIEDWERPLAGPLANVPGVRQLIPERISQTTGQPVATEYPLLRALAGIGTAPRDFVTEEVRRVGVPGQSVFIRETGDYGLDRLVAETYARVLQEELPSILEDPTYSELGTPARQRDYLQRYIFPALKRAALAETRDMLGEGRYTEATVRGENARRAQRQAAMLDSLEAAEPADVTATDPTTAPPPGPPPNLQP